MIYSCTTCTSISDKKKTTLAIAKRSEEYSKAHKLTLAEDLLIEELEQRYSSDLFAIARVVFFLSLIEVQVVQV
jgi:hypothetical protein